MKVLMTTDTLGGVWTYCMELCAALAAHQVEIALATMGRPLSPEQRRQVDALPHVQLHESSYRLCWMQNSREDVQQAGDWLLNVEQAFEPDLVQLNDLAHGGLPWSAPVMLVAHSCVYSWWEAVCKRMPPKDEWEDYHALVRESVRSADLLVTPTESMMNAFLRHYGPARARSVIYNGRDFPALTDSFYYTVDPDPRAGEEGRAGEKLIFAAGRIWDPAKNLGVLSQIADQLPWPIYAAGEQDDPNGGRTLPEGIECLGFLDADGMARWLKRAAIYVAPAHYEPFGLSVLEAARAGCALVLGDISSLREVWGNAALYVDPDDPEEIRNALLELTASSPKRYRLARRAWERAKRFTAARMAGHYMHCYRQMIQDHGSTYSSPARESRSGAHL